MLYVAMIYNPFAWHVEDHNLASINYHHQGDPKTWYGVGPHNAHSFEELAREHVFSGSCNDLLLEKDLHRLLIGKCTMFSPEILMAGGVEVLSAVQQVGDFVVTFPGAYHAGFSHGYNCGEAVNFATPDWFQKGDAALLRYSDLAHPSIINHDAYLCEEMKTAMEEMGGGQENAATKAAFYVRFDRTRRTMLEIREGLADRVGDGIMNLEEAVICSVCKTHCHMAIRTCKCKEGPMCLSHFREVDECVCENVLISLHREWPQWEEWARRFESEELAAASRKRSRDTQSGGTRTPHFFLCCKESQLVKYDGGFN